MGTTTARTKCTVCYPYKPEQNFHLISFLTTRILQVLGQPCRPSPFISNDRYQMWRTKANTCFFWDVTTPSYQISSQGKVRHSEEGAICPLELADSHDWFVSLWLIDRWERESLPPKENGQFLLPLPPVDGCGIIRIRTHRLPMMMAWTTLFEARYSIWRFGCVFMGMILGEISSHYCLLH